MITSIRTKLLVALLALAASVSLLAGVLTYRQVLAETSELFDYQLRQMALSLRSRVPIAPRIELPPEQGSFDFVVQIWDLLGSRTYLSRPGLPVIDQPVVGYANVELDGQRWRVYGLQTLDGVIQIAQPISVREAAARASALRVLIPFLVLVPILGAAIIWVVRSGLAPLKRVASEVQRRDVDSLAPVSVAQLPSEVAPLIDELNRLLARVENAFANQRAFIADAAHELRSPLTAVRLQLQLLDRAPDDPARADARANLGAAVDRAVHMVEQLLALARAEPREVRMDLNPVSLERAAIEAITDTHAFAQSRHITVELDADHDARVMGDAPSLRTLARNLVDNAVRYTPERGRVRVLVRNTRAGAVLEVADTGPGIPAGERDRAFDRFYRRASNPDGGSGLGLAIVKAIADRHSANVTLEDAATGDATAGSSAAGHAAGPGLRVAVAFPAPS